MMLLLMLITTRIDLFPEQPERLVFQPAFAIPRLPYTPGMPFPVQKGSCCLALEVELFIDGIGREQQILDVWKWLTSHSVGKAG